jgi:EAL domain-containing protein (putative c-di-GMP-specific phosphodiesterase class I)
MKRLLADGLAEAGLDRVLELARRHLGMDLAFVAEFTGGKHVFRALDGDAQGFGCELDEGPPLADSYCRLMTAGHIPHAIPDTAADGRVRDLPVTSRARIGSYVGVPIRLADGTLYGSLCCLSHEAQPVDGRDVRFLSMLAELIAGQVAAQRELDASRRLLEDILDAASIAVALQPIVDVHRGDVVGVEALSRFPAGYGAPDRVFAEAHRVGLGPRLEGLAVRQAVGVLPLLGPERYLSVNLSPAVAFDFAGHVDAHPDIPYDRLVLEITEHSAVQSYAELRQRLEPARRRGLRLAIDDAGAGYASLHHVVELTPDIIKIDRCLIDGVASDRARRSVVAAFVALGREIGASLVAEGVEHVGDLEAARDLGVGAAQGYLLARPSTDRHDLAAWVADGVAVPGGVLVDGLAIARAPRRRHSPLRTAAPMWRRSRTADGPPVPQESGP